MANQEEFVAEFVARFQSYEQGVNALVSANAKLARQFDETSKATDRAEKAILGQVGAQKTQTQSLRQSTSAWDKQNRIYEDYLQHQAKATTGNQRATESIISQRYALYDLATTYGVISAALIGVASYTAVLGAQFERAFTNVERTVTPGTASIKELREELVNLSTQIPLTFEEITKIATLGNQLGIAGKDVTEFTEVVAQFAAVSGVSIEEVATSFGQISNLLGVMPEDFDRLASSIELVGVNSAASDAQIIAVAKQLGSTAADAGLAADELVGLSGTLASLSIAPEAARSALQQFFGQLNRSVAEGGDSLANFAAITGTTSEELTQLVKNGQGMEVFTRFLNTLSQADTVEATQALDTLGLSTLRTDRAIRALANNTPLLTRALSDAGQGWDENAELARQYGLIVDDLASQWQLFINSINAAITDLTQGNVQGLAGLLAQVTAIINAFRDFAKDNPWIGQAVTMAINIAAVVGALVAFRVASLLATASTYAFATAQSTLSGNVSGVRGLLATLIPGLITYTRTAEGATIATRNWGAAIGTLAKSLVVFYFLGEAISLATDFEGTIRRWSDQFSFALDNLHALTGGLADFYGMLADGISGIAQFIPALGGLADALRATAEGLGVVSKSFASGTRGKALDALFGSTGEATADMSKYFNQAAIDSLFMGDSADYAGGQLGGLGDSAAGAAKEVRTLVDYANDLSGVFSRAFDIQFGSQAAMDVVTTSWMELNEEIAEYRRKVQELTADRALQQYFLSVANQFGDTLRAGVLASNIADLNAEIADAQAGASTQLNGNSKAAITNRKRLNDLTKQYQDYITALAASGADQATLNAAVAQAEAEFLAQAKALGYSNAQLQPYVQSFRNLGIAIAGIPRNITVTPNLNPALQALNEFVARASAAGKSAGSGFAAGVGAGVQAGANRIAKLAELQKQMADMQITLAQYLASGNYSGARYMGQAINALGQKIRSGNFWTGGYVGNGGKYEPKGVVHGGEFVMNKEATSKLGIGNLYALQKAAQNGRGYAAGGYVPRVGNSGGMGGAIYGMVDLSPATISNLARAVAPQVVVNMDPVQVARSANKGNQQLQARGSR